MSIEKRKRAASIGVVMALFIGGLAIALWQEGWSDQGSPPSDPASMKVEGRLTKIQGRYYVIEDAEGKEVYLLVSQDTQLSQKFKVGDQVEVLTSPIEHAIAIRATVPGQESHPIDSASRTITGKLISKEGKYYVVQDPDGKEIHLLVDEDTELAGEFGPGAMIEVFTSPVEHAVAIQSAK